MVRVINVSGYEEFRKTVEEVYTNGQKLNILFTGQKNEKNESWCPDCNIAEPHITKALQEYAGEDSVFLTVDVGDRTFWKNMENPYRKDTDIKLAVIPTLLRWKSVLRLDGELCGKKSLLEMFFTEEED